MGGAGFPPCWLFGPRQPNTGAYPGSLVGLVADSGRAHAKEYFPELLLPVSLSSQWDTATPTPAGDPPTLAGRFGSVSVGSLLLPLGAYAHTTLCVPSKSGVSVSPRPVEVLQPNPSSFNVWFSRNYSPHCRTPTSGSLTLAQNLHSSEWTSVVLVFSSLWVTHPAVMGFYFIVIASLLLSHCGFSFVFGLSYLVSPSVFLSMIVQQLVVIPVLSQEGVRARPSTPPSWTNLLFNIFESISWNSNASQSPCDD